MKKQTNIFSKFLPRNWSIATQIVIIILFLFIIFFVLQVAVSNRIFNNYFILKQKRYFTNLTEEISSKVKSNKLSTFDAIDQLNSDYGIFPMILDENYELVNSSEGYYIYITNKDDKYLLSNYYHNFKTGDTIVNLKYQIIESLNSKVKTITEVITNNNTYKYEVNPNYTVFETGSTKIERIEKPIHQNNRLKSALVLDALAKIKKENVTYEHNSCTFTFNKAENVSIILILNKLNSGYILASIIPVNESQNLLNTINLYNGYVYFLITVVILFATILIANLIATPIKELTYIADDVANLDFDVEEMKYGNKEVKDLSKSIYKIAKNMSMQFDKLNKQKEEIESLSFEQKEKYEVKKNLVASMSHELKTPLFVIQTTINAILDGLFTKTQAKIELDNINQEIIRCSKMVEEILNIYKIDTNNSDLTFEPLDLVAEIKQLLKDYGANFKAKKLQIHLIKNKDEIEVYANINQFSRVLNNILLNAMKYTPNENKIEIEILDYLDKTILSVTNYGVNIPDDELPYIFDAFYRVDKSGHKKDNIGGNGLGLYITKEILNSHHFPFKAINVDNGFCFEITIPKI